MNKNIFRYSIVRLLLVSKLALTLLVAGQSAAQAADWQYTVRPADTLWSLCREYSAYSECWRELGPYNNILEPRALSIGERLKIPVAWLKKAPVAARVAYVNGQVLTGRHGEEVALTENKALGIGDRVLTLEGNATLQFADGSVLTMVNNSEITIDAVSAFKQSRSFKVQVSLPTGAVRVKVPDRVPRTHFDVKTPSAVAAVRGTQFRVDNEAESGGTRSEVLDGAVALSNEGVEVSIDAGFGAKATPGQAVSAPVQLLSAPEWNLSCTDPGYAEWESLPEAKFYKLTLLEDDTSADKIVSERQLKKNHYTFTDLEEKCYQLKVSAVDAEGFNGMESQRPFCYELILTPPLMLSSAWQDNQLHLSWESVPFAESYRVEVSPEPDFSQLSVSESVAADSGGEVTLSLSKKPEQVYVRVNAEAAGQRSEYSETRELEHVTRRGWLIGLLAAIAAFAVL